MKSFFSFHEGLNFVSKINLINMQSGDANADTFLNIMNDGYFDFIKEKGLFSIQRIKMYNMIICILNASEAHKFFASYFYENLNFFTFIEILKLRVLSEKFELNINFTSQEDFLVNLIKTANQHPHKFLSIFEHYFNINIDPQVKFKASISREHFLDSFTEKVIWETDPTTFSYIKAEEVAFYLLSKCINANKTSKRIESANKPSSLKVSK